MLRFLIKVSLILALTLVVAAAGLSVSGDQQSRVVLRRVIKSTAATTQAQGQPKLATATSSSEKGAVAEISSKEADNFGQRNANDTTASQANSTAQALKQQEPQVKQKQQAPTSVTSAPPSSTTAPTSTSTSTTSSTTSQPPKQQPAAAAGPSSGPKAIQAQEVELLSSAPSSWQHMTAVEAPAAMLIASGVRSASSDLSSSGSTLNSVELSTGDFLRASATKGSSARFTEDEAENFSRVQTSKQQQSFFYPQQARPSGKTSAVKGTKTQWYQPQPTTSTTTTTTTVRPAPLIQEQYVEQQNEQYVEQAPQVEYGAAPLGQAEPFAFDFKTQDNSGNGQYRKEESDKDGVVRGSYGYTDANGVYRHVDYVADQNGFRANIKSNEPGMQSEAQPASIQLNGGAKSSNSGRLLSATSNQDSSDWVAHSSNDQSGFSSSSSDLVASAPANFESIHKSDRLRSPRNYRV